MTDKSSEVGIMNCITNGRYWINWDYNDHVVSILVTSDWATGVVEQELDIKVHFEGFDVTNKYIEKLPNRETIRPTLDNLQTILKIIDENVDDYVQTLEGGDTDADSNDAGK